MPAPGAGRPATRPTGLRPSPLSGRGERPDPSALGWKPSVPFAVGDYQLELESELGAYGVTYAGHDRRGDPVQVLVFHPAFFSAYRRAANLERLERATRYTHSGLAPLLAVGELGQTRWGATRPVGGTPLTHWRRDQVAMPLVEILRVVAQLAQAVEVLHQAGGVHGGLSPETIRFYPSNDAETGARADRVVLVHPFWLDAADVPPAELRPPRTAWLAPELVFGEPADAAVDIYGVGLVLGYLLACGMTEPGHSLLVQGIDVPPGLDDVYVIATSRQPEHRFESVAALCDALAVAAGPDWSDALERSRHGASVAATATVMAEVLEVEEADIEATGEDEAIPAFAVPAVAESHDSHERTDTALPAFVLEDETDFPGVGEMPHRAPAVPRTDSAGRAAAEDSDAGDDSTPRAEVSTSLAAASPVTGRGQRRVVVQTLPHGQRSGLLPVAEFAPPSLPSSAEIPAATRQASEAGPSSGVPSIAPQAASATPDTLVRVRTPASSVSPRPEQAPPPLPGASRASAGGLPGGYSSSLEVLELGPPSLPPMPPPFHSGASDIVDPELEAESTLVEPVAPALLESLEAQAPFLLGATPPPASEAHTALAIPAMPAEPEDEPEFEPLPGASLSSFIPDNGFDASAMRPAAGSSASSSGLLARTEHLPSGPLMPMPPLSPDAFEPRTSRDPSGALAGATVIHSGTGVSARPIAAAGASAGPSMAQPTLGELHRVPLSGHIARPVEKSRGWMLWAVLLALIVGGLIAFLAFGSDAPRPDGVAVPTSPGPDVVVASADTATPADTVADTGPTPPDALAVAGPDGADAATLALADAAGSDTPVDTAVAQADTTLPDTSVAVADTSADTTVAVADTTLADTTLADTTLAVADTTPADTTAADTALAAGPMPELITEPDKLKCPDGMLRMKRKIKVDGPAGEKFDSWEVACIDRFEYPGAGASPAVGLDISGARAACVSRGKRLCTRSEWRRACGGTYPYGKDYDPERCNTAGSDGTPKPIVAAGSKKTCMSPSGAFDMVGNVAEWTSDGFINGGTSMRNAEDATCGSASRRAGGAPHVGFRCCADAK